MADMWRELSGWQKAVVIGGTAAAGLGLAWYLFRESDDDEVEPDYYKVLESAGANVGLRVGPDTNSQRTGDTLYPGEVFGVDEVVPAENGQEYYKLSDGRGWSFKISARDGRELIAPSNQDEKDSMPPRPMEGGMPMMNHPMMAEMQKAFAENPALMQQVMQDPQFQAMMSDPAMVRQMMAQSPTVAGVAGTDPAATEAALQMLEGQPQMG
jgi:hypothetical protein